MILQTLFMYSMCIQKYNLGKLYMYYKDQSLICNRRSTIIILNKPLYVTYYLEVIFRGLKNVVEP